MYFVFSQCGREAKNIKNLTIRCAILGWGGILRTEGDSRILPSKVLAQQKPSFTDQTQTSVSVISPNAKHTINNFN